MELLAIIYNNVMGGASRVLKDGDGYYLQDGDTLYKLDYDGDADDFDVIDFLSKAKYSGERKLSIDELIKIIFIEINVQP